MPTAERDQSAPRRRPPGSPGRVLLTLDEAAELLAVSRRTVYSMIGRDELVDVYPTPGAHRITQASVFEYLSRLTGQR